MGRNRLTAVILLAGVGLTSCSFLDGSSRSDQTETAAQPLPTATPTEGPARRGRDLGLGFPVCNIRRLSGIDFLGNAVDGTAWTATKLTKDGQCNKGDTYLVAADVTGDGKADKSWGPLRHCFVCEPFGAVDFDADGDDELVVLAAGGTVVAYQVLAAERTSDGSIEFGPLKVAEPGNPAGNLHAERPIHFWAGGDEGYSAATACDAYPEDPVLIVAWSNHPVDGPGSERTEIHISRLVLRDGAFHVVDAVNTAQPTAYGPDSLKSLPEEFSRRGRECGLKFYPF